MIRKGRVKIGSEQGEEEDCNDCNEEDCNDFYDGKEIETELREAKLKK